MLDVYEELELVEDNDYLAHYGILGMKWGVRRYQNPDGSLTSAGASRYGSGDVKNYRNPKEVRKKLNNLDKISSNYVGENIHYREKARKYKAKAMDSVEGSKRESKYLEKEKKALSKAEKAANTSKSIDSESWKTMGNSAEKGLSTSMRDVVRWTSRGKKSMIGSHVIAGIPADIINTSMTFIKTGDRYKTQMDNGRSFNQTEAFVVGKKYKVYR